MCLQLMIEERKISGTSYVADDLARHRVRLVLFLSLKAGHCWQCELATVVSILILCLCSLLMLWQLVILWLSSRLEKRRVQLSGVPILKVWR